MTDLKVAEGFSLPLDLVVQQTGILARTGAGKTNAAVVIAEELLAQQQQVVILDPPGAHWGLRSSFDGTAAGYPIIVLGGDHGDLPLEASAGAVIADLVVDDGISAVLDLSSFSNREMTAFATAFAERLYFRKSKQRDPMLLIVEEADELAPQRPMHEQARMLGAMERLVKRGRMRGIGTLLITQRSASLNKNVLSQVELLIALQTTAPQDIKAIDEWVERHGDQEKRRQLLEQIASLPTGTAFVWSPAWLRIFQQVHFRRRRTFDSSATPKPGQRRLAPKTLADVDLAKLRERLVETVERAKAEDPKELRRQVAELKQRLAQQTQPSARQAEVVKVVERVEVPVLDDTQMDRLQEMADSLSAVAMRVIDAADSIRGELARARATSFQSPKSEQPSPRPAASEKPAVEYAWNNSVATDVKLGLAERKVLTALAQYPQGRSKTQVAILTGYAVGGGGFGNSLSALRSKGLIEGGKERLQITGQGLQALGSFDPLPTGRALVDHWLGQLGRAERTILEVLVSSYPATLSKEELGRATGYEHSGGGFNNALSKLRTLELIAGRGELMASREFFE